MNDDKRSISQGEKGLYVEKVGKLHITYAGKQRIPRVLTKPPVIPETILGRNDDLRSLRRICFQTNKDMRINYCYSLMAKVVSIKPR